MICAMLLGLALASTPGDVDTLRLPELYRAAVARDARAGQRPLHARAHELRLRELGTERLPRLRLEADVTHQSDVPRLPLAETGARVPDPPHTRYQASVQAEQRLYDGGVLAGREAVERARHGEVRAGLEVSLFPLHAELTEAFFGALLLQVQEEEVRLLLADLETRLAQLRSSVRAGAALPGDTAAVEAERLRALQRLDAIGASRGAALAVLTALTGRSLAAETVLALPSLEAEVSRMAATGGAGARRERPEFERFAWSRERLQREEELVAARARPRLHAFARWGAGRPGPFQLFSDRMHGFGSVGLRLQWQPWSWGGDAAARELLRLEQRVVATEEAALASRIGRQSTADAESIRHLERALESDTVIVRLREQVERQALRRFGARVITAPEYVRTRLDVLEARLAWQRRRVELEHARARYLITLGRVPGWAPSCPATHPTGAAGGSRTRRAPRWRGRERARCIPT